MNNFTENRHSSNETNRKFFIETLATYLQFDFMQSMDQTDAENALVLCECENENQNDE